MLWNSLAVEHARFFSPKLKVYLQSQKLFQKRKRDKNCPTAMLVGWVE